MRLQSEVEADKGGHEPEALYIYQCTLESQLREEFNKGFDVAGSRRRKRRRWNSGRVDIPTHSQSRRRCYSLREKLARARVSGC